MLVVKQYQLEFSPETVYSAWVSSDTVIPPATSMDIKAVAGGHFRLYAADPDFSTHNFGTFSMVEPNQHLRYSWQWSGDPEMTVIDVTFTAKHTGTQIDLIHSGFRSRESQTMHDSGWDSYIQGLGKFLSENNE